MLRLKEGKAYFRVRTIIHMKFQNFSLLFLSKLQNLDKLYGPFLWMGFNCLQDKSHFEEVVYFLPISSQKLLVLILPTSEE